jgi:hypothetical protein
LTVELSDAVFAAIRDEARTANSSPAELAAAALEQHFGRTNGARGGERPLTEAERHAARQRFERRFGTVAVGHPSCADNEAIDADLAREYADRHEDA